MRSGTGSQILIMERCNRLKMAVGRNLVEEVLTGEGEIEKHITARKPIQRVTHAGQERDKHSNTPKLRAFLLVCGRQPSLQILLLPFEVSSLTSTCSAITIQLKHPVAPWKLF